MVTTISSFLSSILGFIVSFIGGFFDIVSYSLTLPTIFYNFFRDMPGVFHVGFAMIFMVMIFAFVVKIYSLLRG